VELTLAESLLLLAFDSAKGKDTTSSGIDGGLAGALLIDLSRRGCVSEVDGRIVAAECADPGHPLAAEAYASIDRSRKTRTAKQWVTRLPSELKPLRDRVARGLVERHVLSEQSHKLLGLFPSTRFPEADPAPEQALRGRLSAILLSEREPAEQDALLLALLAPYGLVKTLVPRDRRKEATRRAKAIAEGGIAGRAVADSVRDVQIAVQAGVIAAVTISSTDGGGGGGDGGGGGS
jgi:golgi phosphoprotein 3